VKADFKNEGQTLKQLFKEEFGGVKSQDQESEAVQFKLEGEEQKTTKNGESTTKTEAEKKLKRRKRKDSSLPNVTRPKQKVDLR